MEKKILFTTVVAMMLAMFSLHSRAVMSAGVETTPTQSEEQFAETEKSDRGSVSRATFTSAVVDNEPTDYLKEIENSVSVVYFFAELDGMAGQTATHRWKHDGAVMAEEKFVVKDSRFVSWSSNKMPPESTGVWIVEVINSKNEVISTHNFNYLAPL
jgi:hypothetical protein